MSQDSSPSHGMPPRPTSRGPAAALSPGSPVRLIRQLSAGRQQQQQQQQAERQGGGEAGKKLLRAPPPGQAASSGSSKAAADRQHSNPGSRPRAKASGGPVASPSAATAEQAAAAHARGPAAQHGAPDAGPSSPEEGIDQCMAALEALAEAAAGSGDGGGGGNRHAIKTEELLVAHRLNTCFMAARSFTHAVALAERASFGRPAAAAPGEQRAASAGRSSAPGGGGGGGGGRLMQALIEMLHNAEPHAVLALNCLSFLAVSPLVVRELMAPAGLVPLLLGQLRHGQALEPLLTSSSLALLVTLAQADAQQAPHRIVPRHLASLAGVAAGFLAQAERPLCQDLALQLVEEMVRTRSGAQLVRSHKALGQALHQAAGTAGEGGRQEAEAARFRRRLSTVCKLADMLATQEAIQAIETA